MTARHLLLIGFFGEGNLGDDAILRGIASAMPPKTPIVATAGVTPLPADVAAIRRRGIASWPSFIGALRDSRLVVASGGLLQDWSFEGVSFYALRLYAARLAGVPTALLGAGIGPLRRRAARRLAEAALSGIDVCMLRDVESVDLFNRLTGRRADLGTDWSWALAPESSGCTSVHAIPDDSIALNIRPWLTPEWQDAARRWWPRAGNANRIGIAARGEDRRLLESLFGGLPVDEPADFPSLLTTTARLREGWAMRYHVLLAMLRSGIPVRALPYDRKAMQLAANAGLPIPSPTDPEPPEPRTADPGFISAETGKISVMKDLLRRTWENAS